MTEDDLGAALQAERAARLGREQQTKMDAELREAARARFRAAAKSFAGETLQATLAAAGFRLVEWAVVPRSFMLRAGSVPARGSASPASPALPVGWLGDVVLAVARPDEPVPQDFTTRR